VVSHDRAFLDNVVTSTLAFEGGGRVTEYAGGYSDWVRQRPAPRPVERAEERPTPPAPAPASSPKKRKLSFKEAKELEGLPQAIDDRERERERLYASLADTAFLRNGPAVAQAKARLAEVLTEIDVLTRRWAHLETLAGDL
jgi:ATP-binding cassette subfamily F protein uup